jgi:hypothetical protein
MKASDREGARVIRRDWAHTIVSTWPFLLRCGSWLCEAFKLCSSKDLSDTQLLA